MNKIGDLGGYPSPVWFRPDGVANILSLAQLKEHCLVVYDSAEDEAAFHCIKPDGTTRDFVPSLSGLHYCDARPNETVADNKVNSIMTDGESAMEGMLRLHHDFQVKECHEDGEPECILYNSAAFQLIKPDGGLHYSSTRSSETIFAKPNRRTGNGTFWAFSAPVAVLSTPSSNKWSVPGHLMYRRTGHRRNRAIVCGYFVQQARKLPGRLCWRDFFLVVVLLDRW